MLRRVSTHITPLTILLIAPAALAAQNLSDRLEGGIFKEQTAGDLDPAITIYDRIVSDAAARFA